MRKPYMFLFPGMIFGFLLSRAGFSDYDLFMDMFLFTNLKLVWTMFTAIGVAMLSMYLIRKFRARSLTGEPVRIKIKSLHRGTLAGGLIFGVGWGMSGACPGTVLAQLGEGKIPAAFTFSGIVFGIYLFAILYPRLKKLGVPLE
ncbi:MAG: YeeE/YedE family protein [Deferribacteres bacterium]|nr:YeeE/YedE family protein [Deferribacteres bacterium]